MRPGRPHVDQPAAVRELADPGHLGRRARSRRTPGARAARAGQPRTHPHGGAPPRASCRGPRVRWTSGQQAGDGDVVSPAPEGGEDREPFGRLVVLRQRPLEGQRGALGQRPDVRVADPGGEVVGQAVRLLVVARHDDDRVRAPPARVPRREVAGPRGGGHTKDARFRQMRPKGVDERSDAAITTARRGHGRADGTEAARARSGRVQVDCR